MSTVAPPQTDAVAAFNSQLALAKLGAIRILQDLMSTLSHSDASAGRGSSAIRELRLIATSILRAQPLKTPAPAPATTPRAAEPANPQTPAASVPSEPPPPSPTNARRLPPPHPASITSRIPRPPARAPRSNSDVAHLLARRTFVGAPAP